MQLLGEVKAEMEQHHQPHLMDLLEVTETQGVTAEEHQLDLLEKMV